MECGRSRRCPALAFGVKTAASRTADPAFFPLETLLIRSFTGWLPRKAIPTWDFESHAGPLNLTPSGFADSQPGAVVAHSLTCSTPLNRA
jgi:hypothetical protein